MQRKKSWIKIGLLGLCSVLVIASLLCVGISGEPLDAGGSVCISFDKLDMLRADKLIFGFNGKTYTITDPDFIKAFCKETLAGTHQSYCCSDLDEGWMEIYRGERLVRRMRYIGNHDAFAYEADITHWVFFGKEGHVFLTREIWEELREIIK